jgi:murein DD-endopeptidase MepM/ murein hydrolase activator NlpD
MKTRLYPVILLASSAALLASCAQPPAGSGVKDNIGIAGRLSHTCKNPNPGNIFREPDGGYHESFQGWFYKAEVHQGTGWAQAYCYYGLDLAAPSNRPVYSVHYEMTGYNQNECSVSGMAVTCLHSIVIKP